MFSANPEALLENRMRFNGKKLRIVEAVHHIMKVADDIIPDHPVLKDAWEAFNELFAIE